MSEDDDDDEGMSEIQEKYKGWMNQSCGLQNATAKNRRQEGETWQKRAKKRTEQEESFPLITSN